MNAVTELELFTFDGLMKHKIREFAAGSRLVDGLESHLYVVEFGAHCVKVGISARPETRIGSHVRDGRNLGRLVTRAWLSGPHIEARSNERALIAFCWGAAATPGRRVAEYVTVPYEQAVDHAKGLPMSRGDAAAHEAKVQQTADMFKAFVTGVRP